MSKPTDPTIKTLVEITPQDWLRLTERKLAPTHIIDADVGTIRGAADKVIRVDRHLCAARSALFRGSGAGTITRSSVHERVRHISGHPCGRTR